MATESCSEPWLSSRDVSRPAVIQFRKVVAGGQTGVDQAALAAATKLGLQTGGWCPLNCIDENGLIQKTEEWGLTQVTETIWEANRAFFESLGLHYDDEDQFARRTLMNALHSSGTVTIQPGPVKDGTNLGVEAVKALPGKPMLILSLQNEDIDRQTFLRWIAGNSVDVLNVNGPRESSSPGIGIRCLALFEDWFASARSQEFDGPS